MSDKVYVQFLVSREEREALRRVARDNDRNMSQQVRAWIRRAQKGRRR